MFTFILNFRTQNNVLFYPGTGNENDYRCVFHMTIKNKLLTNEKKYH